MIKNVTTVLSLGMFSGVSIHDVRDVCENWNVTIKAFKQGGFFVKTYTIELEGETLDIAKVLAHYSLKEH